MAGAKPGVHVVQLRPISVPEALINGNKFIMFYDVSIIVSGSKTFFGIPLLCLPDHISSAQRKPLFHIVSSDAQER